MTESLAIIPRSVEELESLAERLAKSTLIPAAMRDKMPNVLVTIMAGQEMGLAPMAALRSIHVIEGKPVISADGMVAVVLGSGRALYFTRVEESDTAVTYETHRKGDPHPRRCTWTLEMAKAAGLNLKDNWRAYRRAMLASRAKAELARDVYPDVLAGVMSHDEASDAPFTAPATAPARPMYSPTADVIDAEVVSETSVDVPPWALEIDACETETQLTEMAPNLVKLPDGEKALAKARYKERLHLIRKSGGRAPAVPFPPTGTTCSDCHEPQIRTPQGDTCPNGHGGADPDPQPAPAAPTKVELLKAIADAMPNPLTTATEPTP